MKERLACNKCEGIICADIGENKRVIGQIEGQKWIIFPENVENCIKRIDGIKIVDVEKGHTYWEDF
jgi:hypothetical protein